MRSVSTVARAIPLVVGAMIVFPSVSAAQAPPTMGGGYTNVIPIPVDDPTTKAIAGALFKPAGAGPFPAIVYLSGCAGLNIPPEMALEQTVIDHLLLKGVAAFVVDPFTPRNELEGICAKLNGHETWAQYATRGGNDAIAAVKVLGSMPDIDPNHIFLQGYSFGAESSLFAIDTKTSGAHDTKIAGLIAFYPYCDYNIDPAVPTLVLIGEKDDWTPAVSCQLVKGKQNLTVVVFPGATHWFVVPMDQPVDYLGHHMIYDAKAAQDAQERADAFMDAHMK